MALAALMSAAVIGYALVVGVVTPSEVLAVAGVGDMAREDRRKPSMPMPVAATPTCVVSSLEAPPSYLSHILLWSPG